MTFLSPYFFKKKHVRILLLLVTLDLLATLMWFIWYDIPELNPILSPQIEASPIQFVLTKLALTLPGVYLLSKFIHKKISQWGVGFLLTAYTAVSILHYIIFIKVI